MSDTMFALGLMMPDLTSAFWLNIGPFLILAIGSLIALTQSCFERVASVPAVKNVVLITLTAALAWIVMLLGQPEEVLIGGGIISDQFGRFCGLLIIGISLVVTLLLTQHHTGDRFFRGEITCIFLIITLGSLAMVTAGDMVTLYIGLEASSIGLYSLIGYVKQTRQSQEGAIKYLVLGSFASGFLLFGFALLYAAGGSLYFADMLAAAQAYSYHGWVGLGILMTVSGLAFKLALVPFHLWAPDAYEAAPTPLTAFMATAVKVTILAIIMRIFVWGHAPMVEHWLPALMVLAMLSMIVANVMALVQTSLKRMLAYSSVAHSGYMAVAICGISAMSGAFPYSAVVFYLVAYSVMSLGAFALIGWLESNRCDNLQLDDLTGLAKKHPMAALALAAFMFSFAGLPPSAGFIAKFMVFSAALQAQLYLLVVIGAIGSAIALYYYLRVIVRMYFQESDSVEASVIMPVPSRVIAVLAAASLIFTILFGTFAPNVLVEVTTPVAETLAD